MLAKLTNCDYKTFTFVPTFPRLDDGINVGIDVRVCVIPLLSLVEKEV
jgi:hypothetical protein